ncbi:hypothetical protein BT96DRAFT_919993 [Gymnopus androsaceus JB14]|uniref:NYN domain-containing protein n=1 Tax=Gymnopus androsaceus JB14 TaxID=1447944 RepID=A0A6A4HQQ4_9AGAR|nr:hypothetical protein BT96DRAFT_919993 [Gymnopus androsaceus JB14]
MEEIGQVAVFWDYENCATPSSLSGYELVRRIRDLAHEFGSVKLLKAYTELSEQSINSPRSITLRSELQSSGVSITDCPHNGYKNVADQMIIADLLTFAMDNPTNPSNTTILLMSGDRDFAYPLSVLRLRRYNVVVVAPSVVHPSLRAQASRFFEWSTSILGVNGDDNPSQAARGRPRNGNVISPSLSTITSSLSSSASQSSDNSKEDSKLLRSPIKAHVSAPPPTVMPSSAVPAGPTPSTIPSSLSNGCSRAPETETSPPGYSSITAQPSSSTLLPSPSIPTSSPQSVRNLTNETRLVVPTPVSISSSNLPRAPLPSFPRPSSAGPSFPETTSSLISNRPQAIVAAALARRAAENASNAISQHPPGPSSQYLLSPAPSSTYAQVGYSAEKGSAFTGATDGNKAVSLSGGVMLSTSQVPSSRVTEQTGPASSGDKLVTKASNPASNPPATASALPKPVLPVAKPPLPPAPPPPLKSIPPFFLPLVQHLEKLRLKGTLNADRSSVSVALMKVDKKMYQHAGCTKFKDFSVKAEGMGLVQMGGSEGGAWIKLHPDLHGRIELKC